MATLLFLGSLVLTGAEERHLNLVPIWRTIGAGQLPLPRSEGLRACVLRHSRKALTGRSLEELWRGRDLDRNEGSDLDCADDLLPFAGRRVVHFVLGED